MVSFVAYLIWNQFCEACNVINGVQLKDFPHHVLPLSRGVFVGGKLCKVIFRSHFKDS